MESEFITLCRGPRKTEDALKIGARRVLHHYQRYCVVPLRKELLELRIKDKFIWATYNTEDFSSSKKVISSGTRTVVSRVKLDTNSRNWK
jgi:hypothetical protein